MKIAETPSYSENNHWLNLLQIKDKKYGEDKERLMNRLSKLKIQTRPVWYLNHNQKPYLNCETFNITKSIELFNNSLCLPSSTSITNKDIKTVINSLNVKNKSKDIVIVGAGGLAREVKFLINEINEKNDNKWNLVDLFVKKIKS